MQTVIGPIVLSAAVLFTAYHEVPVLLTVKNLYAAKAHVHSLDTPVWEQSLEGKLILSHGKLSAKEPIVFDEMFVIAVDALQLHRVVEMLQWVETVETVPDVYNADESITQTRNYEYRLEWRKDPVDSSIFRDTFHSNPSVEEWKYRSKLMQATPVYLGQFELADGLLDQLNVRERLGLHADNRESMRGVYEEHHGSSVHLNLPADLTSVDKDYFYMRGAVNNALQAGDMRISFYSTQACNVTICSMVENKRLVPFNTESGYPIHLLEPENWNLNDFFERKVKAKLQNNYFHRIFAGVLAHIGWNVLLSAKNFQEVFRITFKSQSQSFIVSAILSMSMIALTTSLIWLAYTPIWSIMVSFVISAVLSVLKFNVIIHLPEHFNKTA